MPLAAAKTRNNAGRTAGSAVVAGHYDSVTDASNNLKYAEALGNLWVSTAAVPTGSNAVVVDNAQGDSKFAQLSFRFAFTALPSTAVELSQIRNSGGKIVSVLADSSGGVPRLTVRGGGDVTLWAIATGTLALNTVYLLQITGQADTTTTGKLKARLVRESDSVTIASGELTNLNNGTTNFTLHQTGKVPATGTVGFLIDDLAFWDSAYDYLPAAASPPVLVVTSDGPFWMHDGRGVSGGAYTLAHVSGPNHLSEAQEPVEGLFFVPQDSSASTYTMTVTTGSGSDFETVVVPVASSGGPVPGSVRRRVWNGSALL